MLDFLVGIVVGLILVVLIMAQSKLSQMATSLGEVARSVKAIETSLGMPNGGDPDWPDFNADGILDAPPPPASAHKTVASLLRGVYCGNAYTVQLLNRRLK